jgi:hypothetical protein
MEKIPKPVKSPERMGTIQWIFPLYPVQPNQKRPAIVCQLQFRGLHGKRRGEWLHTCEQWSSRHGNRQTPFRNRNVIVRLKLFDVPRVGEKNDQERDEFADNHPKVSKAGNASSPTVYSLKDKGVCSKEEVEKTI